jgi:hypothetical protein
MFVGMAYLQEQFVQLRKYSYNICDKYKLYLEKRKKERK